jgi:hypothetical protein
MESDCCVLLSLDYMWPFNALVNLDFSACTNAVFPKKNGCGGETVICKSRHEGS